MMYQNKNSIPDFESSGIVVKDKSEIEKIKSLQKLFIKNGGVIKDFKCSHTEYKSRKRLR